MKGCSKKGDNVGVVGTFDCYYDLWNMTTAMFRHDFRFIVNILRAARPMGTYIIFSFVYILCFVSNAFDFEQVTTRLYDDFGNTRFRTMQQRSDRISTVGKYEKKSQKLVIKKKR